MEEEEKIFQISKIVIRRYTNFQRKRRIYIIDRTKKEIVIADRYLLWNLDIGFIFGFTRDDEDVSPVQSVDRGEKLLDKSGKLTWPRNSPGIRLIFDPKLDPFSR